MRPDSIAVISENFEKYYMRCTGISKNNSTRAKIATFMEFYRFYSLFMKKLDDQKKMNDRSRNKTQNEKNRISDSINKIKKKITDKKKEIDEILINLNNKNSILPALSKKNTNTGKLFKNLANNINLTYTSSLPNEVNNQSIFLKNTQNEVNNNNFIQRLGINEIQELYKKKSRQSMTQTEIDSLQIVNNILNKKAKKLSEINALKLKQSLGNINKTELNKLHKLELNNLLQKNQ